MRKSNLLDFYREIVNSEKSFGIDYKNLSKQLIERIDEAIRVLNSAKNHYENDKTNWALERAIRILGDKENE